MSKSCLLNGPPIVETFDESQVARYRAFVENYARELERACADVSAAMWATWLRGTHPKRRRSKGV
ncbi:MAG: hypothetical protein V1685_04010 [Parcubacteria group bacterium]